MPELLEKSGRKALHTQPTKTHSVWFLERKMLMHRDTLSINDLSHPPPIPARGWCDCPNTRHGLGHIHPDSADKIGRAAFIELEIEGASTHSFRRTCLTQMHRSGVPLKVIQKISGHKTLSALQKYLEVLDEDLESAVSKLKF